MESQERLIKIHNELPEELDKSVDLLIEAINNNKPLVDCELAQLLGDINMSESCGFIDSGFAKELRKYYIDDVLGGKYGRRV